MARVDPHDPGAEVASKRAEESGDVARKPVREGKGEVRFGTASWTDPTMTAPGVFYPKGLSTAEERLRYYASQFPVVEVDATYYALPSKRTSESWVERTPEDFVFDIKAHALMTGQPTEVAVDLMHGRSRHPCDVCHLGQCSTGSADQQQVRAFGRRAIGDRQCCSLSQPAGRPGDQHGAGSDRVHGSPFIVLRVRLSFDESESARTAQGVVRFS